MERVSTDRRDFMKAAGVLAVTTAANSLGMRGARAQQVPYSAGTEAPKLKAPANACDCHMHIYDAKYPTAPSATLKPPDALVADYKLLQKRIGTTRNVVVTPSTYGTDNRVALDAMAQIGATARGVAVVDTSVADAELKRMNDLGIRGIRFNLVQAGATTTEMIEPLSRRRERSRLAYSNSHEGRADRRDRRFIAARSLSDRVRSPRPSRTTQRTRHSWLQDDQ
jgi:hypothetical protein